VQSVPKVPDCGFGGRYHIDFLGMPFRGSPPQLAVENFREIKGQILKTALSAVNARLGRPLVRLALEDSRVSSVIAPTRRPMARHSQLQNPIIDFDSLDPSAPWWRVHAVISGLGTKGSLASLAKTDGRKYREL